VAASARTPAGQRVARAGASGSQLGQKREDLPGRLAFAENHFRDAGPPPAIYVQQGELAQRDAGRPDVGPGRYPRHTGTLSRHG
jgi:hypothetical protein